MKKKFIAFEILKLITLLVILFSNIALFPFSPEKGNFSAIEEEIGRLGVNDFYINTALDTPYPGPIKESIESSMHLAVGLITASESINYLFLEDIDNYKMTLDRLEVITENSPLKSSTRSTLKSIHNLFSNIDTIEDVKDNKLLEPYVAVNMEMLSTSVSALTSKTILYVLAVLLYKFLVAALALKILDLIYAGKAKRVTKISELKNNDLVSRQVVFDFMKENNQAVVVETNGNVLLWTDISFSNEVYPRGWKYKYSGEDGKHVFVEVPKKRR